ncbi:MAG: MSHA bioproteinis protein MshJ [Gallionellaceae bacterium]|nr:MAG: MSHA bioproteinis protein MshJ [Gallionellaceae bacterium]
MMTKLKPYWGKLAGKVDDMSLRERVLIFSALAFLLVSLVNALFIDALLEEQKKLSGNVVRQQEKTKEIQARIEALLQARRNDANSPLRLRLNQIKQQVADGDAYLQGRRDRLVAPEKMADLLRQVLGKNGKLQLVGLQTLPVASLIETTVKPDVAGAAPGQMDRQVFRHGVQITVRGGYPDLLNYLTELERLPSKMFWGMAKMSVVQHPAAELTLTIYTLSLDKTWLQV